MVNSDNSDDMVSGEGLEPIPGEADRQSDDDLLLDWDDLNDLEAVLVAQTLNSNEVGVGNSREMGANIVGMNANENDPAVVVVMTMMVVIMSLSDIAQT